MNPHNAEYHNLLEKILGHGHDTGDRTGTGTRSLFGEQMKFDLQEGFPLLTTKKVFTKGIIHELLWFISGGTSVSYLLDNDVHIWDQWTPAYKLAESLERGTGKEALMGLHKSNPLHKDLDLGPVYGSQWRDFGGLDFYLQEEDGSTKKIGRVQGVDQLKGAIDRIKTNPTCRRIIVSAWNPQVIDDMALPPCHCFYHFKVYGDTLDMLMYQRSCDVFLGVPFNIASYALLQHMVAQVTGLKVGTFTHTMGDVHIYNTHTNQVTEQLARDPNEYEPPVLDLNPDVMNIEEFTYDDIDVVGYNYFPAIKAPVSV